MAHIIKASQALGQNPGSRGYHVVYREREVNHCPGCGRTHWYVGRTMAECAFCETALPLEASKLIGQGGAAIFVRRPAFGAHPHACAA